MSRFKGPDFVERQGTAADAKKAALEKFRANSAANNPAVAERQADRNEARQASRIAREARATERAAARIAHEAESAEQAARARQSAEQADREAAAKAESDRVDEASRELTLKVERKAARDARYAARKARKR